VPPPTTPTKPADIATRSPRSARPFPDNCELITLPKRAQRRRAWTSSRVRLHDGTGTKDPAVLVTGGVPRQGMGAAGRAAAAGAGICSMRSPQKDITFGPLTALALQTSPNPPVSVDYPAFTIPHDPHRQDVQQARHVLPAVPRTRTAASSTSPAPERRSRPAGAGTAAPTRTGRTRRRSASTSNRNFDIGLGFRQGTTTWSATGPRTGAAPAATTDLDDTFNGVLRPGPHGDGGRRRYRRLVHPPVQRRGHGTDRVRRHRRRRADPADRAGHDRRGNVTVTGPDGGPYQVTFTGARAHPVAMLTANYAALTGPASSNPHIEVRHGAVALEPETDKSSFSSTTARSGSTSTFTRQPTICTRGALRTTVTSTR